MMLWIALAVLALLALAVLVRPLVTAAPSVEGGDDAEVYASQLDEVEADLTRGAIAEAEAEAAKTEIARRLLRARRSGRLRARMRPRDWVTAAALAVFVPAFSIGGYLAVGAPSYGDQPLAARQGPISDDALQRMLARAEERLSANPQDSKGWSAVAPVYERLGRYRDAANAWGRVNALAGPTAERLTAQAENLMLAASGRVTEDARALFAEAAERAPDAVRPAVFLAIAARQDGNYQEAAEQWRALLKKSSGDEAWLEIAAAEFSLMSREGVEATSGIAPPGAETTQEPVAPPAPSREQMSAAAADMPAESREAMIQGMVERLATRLRDEGGTVQEWVRLVQSYKVLGRDEAAQDAVRTALAELSESETEPLCGGGGNPDASSG